MEHLLPVGVITIVSLALALVIQRRVTPNEGLVVMASWAAHFVSTWINMALVAWYYGRGDMYEFHRDGGVLAAAARIDPVGVIPEIVKMTLQMDYVLNVHVGGTGGTETMVGLTALGMIVFGDSLAGLSLLFCMFSYWGKFLLLLSVRELFPVAWRTRVAIAVMLVPSVVFWSAGVIKESVVMTGMGLATIGLYLVRKRINAGAVPLLMGLGLVSMLKAYILMVAAVAFGGTWYFARASKGGTVQLKPTYLLMAMGIGAVGVLAIGQVFPRFSVTNLADEATGLQDRGARGGSKFSLGAAPDSLQGQLLIMPLAVLTGMFRPALFDARNPQMLANAIESTIVMWMTFAALFRLGPSGVIRTMSGRPFLAFCALFSLGMGLGVGLATGNLGTLSRYRMPLMPFLTLVSWYLYRAPARGEVIDAAPAVPAPPRPLRPLRPPIGARVRPSPPRSATR